MPNKIGMAYWPAQAGDEDAEPRPLVRLRIEEYGTEESGGETQSAEHHATDQSIKRGLQAVATSLAPAGTANGDLSP